MWKPEISDVVHIGTNAGQTKQGVKAVAIGVGAGQTNQGVNAIAIGDSAGDNNQAANSIILNATGSGLSSAEEGLYVKPIRTGTATHSLYYDTESGEICASDNATISNLGSNWELNSTDLYPLSTTTNVSIGTNSNTSKKKLLVSGSAQITEDLRLDATISQGDYTYTLPDSSGTLALTSEIPVNTSNLNNNSGFITSDSEDTLTNKKIVSFKNNLDGVITTPETSGTLALTSEIPVNNISNGFTGITSYTQGDLLYYNSGDSLSKLHLGSPGQVIRVNSSANGLEYGDSTAAYSAVSPLLLSGTAFSIDQNAFNIITTLDDNDEIILFDTVDNFDKIIVSNLRTQLSQKMISFGTATGSSSYTMTFGQNDAGAPPTVNTNFYTSLFKLFNTSGNEIASFTPSIANRCNLSLNNGTLNNCSYNGTLIAVNKGGTGFELVDLDGQSGKFMRVNSGATGYEFATVNDIDQVDVNNFGSGTQTGERVFGNILSLNKVYGREVEITNGSQRIELEANGYMRYQFGATTHLFYSNASLQTTNPITVSNTTSTGAFYIDAQFTNQADGTTSYIAFGKNTGIGNRANIAYHYASNESNSNYLMLGLDGNTTSKNQIKIYKNNITEINSTETRVKDLVASQFVTFTGLGYSFEVAKANIYVGRLNGSYADAPIHLNVIVNHGVGNTNGSSFLACRYNGTEIGGVGQASTSSVSFEQTSDYRLKENVKGCGNLLEIIDRIPVKQYNFIADREENIHQTHIGFIAHELQLDERFVFVRGTKDQVKKWCKCCDSFYCQKGNDCCDEKMEDRPQYQSIDYGKITPICIKGIQELYGIIKTQQTEIDLLKSELANIKNILNI